MLSLYVRVYPKPFNRSIKISKKYSDSPRLAFTTILLKINRTVFTNYFYSSQENKLIPTKPTFTTSPTSQKTIIASLLSRWGNNTLTKDMEDLIINSWAEKNKKAIRDMLWSMERVLSRS